MFKNISETRKGEIYVLLGDVIEGFLPILTVFTYATLRSFASLALSTFIASLFFGVIVLYRWDWSVLRNHVFWRHVFGLTLFTGVLFWGLYFAGLEYTTPGNASIIILFQVFASFVFFNLYRQEHISGSHKIGAILMVVGAFIILIRDFSGLNWGDILILCASVCAPIGNYFMQEARKIGPSVMILFLRSAITCLTFFVLTFIFVMTPTLDQIRVALPFLLISGFASFGLHKLLWIEAIHRIPVTKAAALLSVIPFVTLIFSWPLLHQAPNVWQLTSLVPFILGTLLLTDQLRKRSLDSAMFKW